MPRRLLSILAATAIVLAACSGGAAATPVLSDPKLILTNTTTSLQSLKSVHFEVAVSGSINTGSLTGSSGSNPDPNASPALLDLSGTTFKGDINVTSASGQVAVSVPALLAFTANVVVVDGVAYIKTSLGDSKYAKLDLGALTKALPIPSLSVGGSPDPAAASALTAQIDAELAKLPAPTKLADETVNGQDCYHVQEALSSADFPQASGVLNGNSGTLTVDLWSQKSDLRPSRLVIVIDAGSQGKLTLTINLTNYDAAVTIAAPPADQISDKPFSLPGLTP
jgi:hypothetical protein